MSDHRPTLGARRRRCFSVAGILLFAAGCAPEVDDVTFGPRRPDGAVPAPRGGPEERPFWRNKDAGVVDSPVLVDPPGSPAPPQRDGGAAPAPPRDGGTTPAPPPPPPSGSPPAPPPPPPVPPPPPPTADRCSTGSTTTCGTCTPWDGCGWCRDAGRCLSGTSLGPRNGSCTRANWAWYPQECSMSPPPPTTDPCSRGGGSCGACTPLPGCGWCRDLGQCLTGNSVGPRNGACGMDTWDFEPEDCGRAPGSPPPPPAPPPTPPPVPPPPPPPATDGGVTMPPTDGGSVPAPMCIATAPTTGYCRTPGSCNLQAPTVTACDTSMAYDFYGAEYCNARATVIVVGAGWCGACQEEAPVVESTLTQPYRSRGVRVVTLLVENSDRSPATSAFCQRWQSRFGLTSRMVVDPSDTIGRRLSISGYPFIAVIDRRGRIRMAQSAPRMSQVTSLLNTIIAEP